MLYKGNHWTRCVGFMDASWVRLGITNDDWGHLGHYLGTTWGQLGDDLGTTLAKLGKTLAYSGTLWHTLAYSVTLWHTLEYSDIFWHTLAYSGILLHALAYSGINNASLKTADGAYHCPVGSIWPFLAPSGALIAIPTY